MTPLRRQTVEAILRDIARDIAWLESRCKAEGETSGWNRDKLVRLYDQARKLEAELQG